MNLINKNFTKLTYEEFNKTISGLSSLSLIIAPLMLQLNYEGKGAEDAAEFSLDLQIAADAVTEIKQHIFGLEDGNGSENNLP